MGGSRRMCGPIFVGSVRNYQAGSGPDVLARRMAPAIARHVGPRASFVVSNRAGTSDEIAFDGGGAG